MPGQVPGQVEKDGQQYLVVAVGKKAFFNCGLLKRLGFENGVQRIGAPFYLVPGATVGRSC